MRAVIFDLDGTLLDTLEDIANACNTVLKRHGWAEHPTDAYRLMVGNGFLTLIRRALPMYLPLSQDLVLEVVAEARAQYSDHLMDHTRPYEGIPEALEYLVSQGVSMSVLSNKPDDQSKELISHFLPGIPFMCVQGALPHIPLKPDPDGLLAMLKTMGANKRHSCYVGDSNVDMITARNADLRGVGCIWGFRGQEELEQSGAFLLLHHPGELKDLAQQMN